MSGDNSISVPVPGPTDDVERLGQIASELTAVEAALRRLDEGTYGTCEVCGEALDPSRLEGEPALARCPAHT